ncbi:hypothetical protein [Mucilaginibacter aquaedulcis]|uniref:hypothetical protein n=1 Tax=Mucilaginibacter aquaedulcis TaxID=1187081 RepID=UPI0025B4ABAE|nr:hypothetical protein [Mucilaginibacter aquaedulcis]MDN3548821.1 hypothetical protein [Mucilaginibacter aquaedulcis]
MIPMSQKDKCHLTFHSKIIDGEQYNFRQSFSNEESSVVNFLKRIDKFDGEGLINDIAKCIAKSINIDGYFISDSFEDMTVNYEYPKVSINDVFLISMTNLKELLQEWLAFISEKNYL